MSGVAHFLECFLPLLALFGPGNNYVEIALYPLLRPMALSQPF